ncbi:MAG: hypothetical protein WCE80_10030 [Acidimicrobiia bacterium]
MTSPPSVNDKPWWTAQVVAALLFVLFVPTLVLKAIPEPEVVGQATFLEDREAVELAFNDGPPEGSLPWVVAVGVTFGLAGALSWWLGRHSMRVERWRPALARLRDVLLSLIALSILGFIILGQFGISDLGLIITQCSPPECDFVQPFAFSSLPQLLWPWIVFIPVAAGLMIRIGRPPPVAIDPPVRVAYQVAILAGLGVLTLAAGPIWWAILS